MQNTGGKVYGEALGSKIMGIDGRKGDTENVKMEPLIKSRAVKAKIWFMMMKLST